MDRIMCFWGPPSHVSEILNPPHWSVPVGLPPLYALITRLYQECTRHYSNQWFPTGALVQFTSTTAEGITRTNNTKHHVPMETTRVNIETTTPSVFVFDWRWPQLGVCLHERTKLSGGSRITKIGWGTRAKTFFFAKPYIKIKGRGWRFVPSTP